MEVKHRQQVICQVLKDGVKRDSITIHNKIFIDLKRHIGSLTLRPYLSECVKKGLIKESFKRESTKLGDYKHYYYVITSEGIEYAEKNPIEPLEFNDKVWNDYEINGGWTDEKEPDENQPRKHYQIKKVL